MVLATPIRMALWNTGGRPAPASQIRAGKILTTRSFMRTAEKLMTEANLLADRFEAAFWCPKLETYALALDGAKEPCGVRASNAGQLLFTGILAPDRAEKVATGLLRPQFFSGWGI